MDAQQQLEEKFHVPLFDGGNYDNWRFRLEVLLDEKGLLSFVEQDVHTRVLEAPTTSEEEKDKKSREEANAKLLQRDKYCKRLIISSIADSQLEYCKGKTSSYEVWKELESTFRRKGIANQLQGYFRKGEVEFVAKHWSDALLSYRVALRLQPGDPTISSCIEKTVINLNQERQYDEQIPWLGAGIGIILGVSLVLADYTLASKKALNNPMTMLLVPCVCALIGFFVAKAIRYFQKQDKLDLLSGDRSNLFGKEGEEDTVEESEDAARKHNKYSKAQARQRYRKGKT